ncbi:MAG: hypothetical protein JWP12_679 [Bacteroidetes bacterium]|nr:hypothetical protein [Bacteroidota bacterium]
MKKQSWAGILCLAQVFCFALNAHGAAVYKTQQATVILLPAGITASWKEEYKDEQILIESSVAVYEDVINGIRHERVVFRYTNLTSQTITVSFNRTMNYDGVCYGCDHPDKKYSITLAPMESKEYANDNKDKLFFIFSKDLNKTITKKLDSFRILNIEKLAK